MNLFSQTFKPMLLQEKKEPFNSKKYLYELKFDGMRALLFVSPHSFKILNRHEQDVTWKFPELKEIQKNVSLPVIFDGEIVCFDQGKPSFSFLQKRFSLKNKSSIQKVLLNYPVFYICFDILYEKKSLVSFPLIERKKILEKYPDTSHFTKSPIFFDGKKLFSQVKKMGLEGIVAKRKDSFYEIDSRTSSWIKIKNIQREEFFIGGYKIEKQNVSLFLGKFKEKKLYFVGRVSISKEKFHKINVKSLKKEKSPFFDFSSNEVLYVKPVLCCYVEFLEKSKTGKLRHPVFRGLVNFD